MKRGCLISSLVLAVSMVIGTSADAADVKLYGFVDYAVQQISTTNAFTGESNDTVRMVTGERNGNRWGMKASEVLGNNVQVKVHLESGFNADNGQLLSNRIFSRQAALMLATPYGEVKFGRTGGMNSPNDSYLNTGVIATAWGGGTANGATSVLWYNAREDNVIEYMTPEYLGFTGYLHYSFNTNGQEDVDESENQRVMAIGARYHNPLVDIRLSYEKNKMSASSGYADPQTFTAAARLFFNPLVVSMSAQYVEHVRSFGANGSFAMDALGTLDNYKKGYKARTGTDAGSLSEGFKGMGYGLGAWYDIGQWRLITQCSRLDYEVEDTSEDVGFWMGSVGFHYTLSKRTSLWGIAAVGSGTDVADDYEMTQFALGIRHHF